MRGADILDLLVEIELPKKEASVYVLLSGVHHHSVRHQWDFWIYENEPTPPFGMPLN